MTSTLSPPPYTLHDMWRGRYLPTPESYLLSRQFLHVFVVVYGKTLRKLLSKSRYQLSDDEQTHLLSLSDLLKYAVEHSNSEHSNPTSDEDLETIKREVFGPADHLGIPPWFVVSRLWYYAIIADNLTKNERPWYCPWRQRRYQSSEFIRKLLKDVEDVIDCIDVVSPNEEVARLLSDAVINFIGRHCRRDGIVDQPWWKKLGRKLRRQ